MKTVAVCLQSDTEPYEWDLSARSGPTFIQLENILKDFAMQFSSK